MIPTEITTKEFLAIYGLHTIIVGMHIREDLIEAVKQDRSARLLIINSLQTIQKFLDITNQKFLESLLPDLKVNIYSDFKEDLSRLDILVSMLYSSAKDKIPAEEIKKLLEWQKILNSFIKKIVFKK